MPDLDSLISEVSGKGSMVEREVQGRDGHWYSLRMRPYKTAENKIDGVLMALMDIDVMKRGLDQARLSLDDAVAERDLSANLLDMSGALIVILDPAGRIIAFNHASQERSGYSFREVEGRTFWDFLLPPEEVDEAKAAFAGILEGAAPARTYERTWIGKDGSRRVIASSSIARRGADGAVRQIISTGIDITPRKLAAGCPTPKRGPTPEIDGEPLHRSGRGAQTRGARTPRRLEPENGHAGKRGGHVGTDAARFRPSPPQTAPIASRAG